MSAREELFRRVAGAFLSEERANKLIDAVVDEALSDAAEQLRVQRDRIAELEDYERLSPQQCPKGLHADWLIDSEYAHACPWCRIAELEALTPAPIQTCQTCGAGYDLGQPCSVCAFHVLMAIAEKQQRQAEDPHDGPNHHDYALGRDLPFIPQQVTGRCPRCTGTFEDGTCGGAQ
ncbi:hypothetical protein [Streptomyces sp. NPDC004285]